MKPVHCAAVDLGAASGRVIVGTWSEGRLELAEIHRFPNQFYSAAGHDYWDLPLIWTEVVAGLRKARRRFPSLASIGVDTWGADYVLTDDAGRMVFPAHAYRDPRTRPGLERMESQPVEMGRVYASSGIPNLFYNTSLQLEETIARYPAIVGVASRCLLLQSYLNFLLARRMETEISIASTTQLLDVHGTGWSKECLDAFHIPEKWFHTPVAAHHVLGGARDIPELKGVSIVSVPGHDTACAYDAMPAHPAGGDFYISLGTWSLAGFESRRPLLGGDALKARVSNERTGTGLYRPLTNFAGLWLLEQTLREFTPRPVNDLYRKELLADAARLPKSGFALEVSDPDLVNPPSMRAAIESHLKKRSLRLPPTKAGQVRLICDSIGRSHGDAVRSFERLAGRGFARILIVGGGSRNRLVCQATADSSGLPVLSYELEGTAIGNIASQLKSLGAVDDLEEVRRVIVAQHKPAVYTPSR